MTEETGTSGCETTEEVFVMEVQIHMETCDGVEIQMLQAPAPVFGISNHVSSFICSINDDSGPDLKTECLSETEIVRSNSNVSFRETSASSVLSLESEDMASVSTSTSTKKKHAGANDATSRHKPPPPPAKTSSSEEFFSEAEKYEQKRFSEKYNYDIVKDVLMEGRYQWVRLKPESLDP